MIKTSAEIFISKIKTYNGKNLFVDIAFDLGINEEATEAARGGQEGKAIIFADYSATVLNKTTGEWEEVEYIDLVCGFRINDGKRLSEIMYIQTMSHFGRFAGIDLMGIRHACENFVSAYETEDFPGLKVCKIIPIEENSYEMPTYKFGFDKNRKIEWNNQLKFLTQ